MFADTTMGTARRGQTTGTKRFRALTLALRAKARGELVWDSTKQGTRRLNTTRLRRREWRAATRLEARAS